MAEGLSRPLCWAVSVGAVSVCVRIETTPTPASPTEGELAAAKAWRVAHHGAHM